MNTDLITVKNLWHNPQSSYSQPEYKLTGKPIFEHRGVQVYHRFTSSFLHVLDGVAITERAGVDKTGKAIDDVLDGGTCCHSAIAAHLNARGFSPMSYDQYHRLWLAGKVE